MVKATSQNAVEALAFVLQATEEAEGGRFWKRE